VYLGILGLIGVGAYNGLQYVALRTSTPVNVTLIASSLPLWSMIVGVLFYRVHPTRPQLIGAALSLAGVLTVLSRGELQVLLRIQLVEGDLLMVLAIMGWAIYSWMLARPPANMSGSARPDWSWAEFLLGQCLFGVLIGFAAAGVGEVVAPVDDAGLERDADRHHHLRRRRPIRHCLPLLGPRRGRGRAGHRRHFLQPDTADRRRALGAGDRRVAAALPRRGLPADRRGHLRRLAPGLSIASGVGASGTARISIWACGNYFSGDFSSNHAKLIAIIVIRKQARRRNMKKPPPFTQRPTSPAS
jgi:hypothetical protein